MFPTINFTFEVMGSGVTVDCAFIALRQALPVV